MRRAVPILVLLLGGLAVAACDGTSGAAVAHSAQTSEAERAKPLLIAPEDLLTLGANRSTSGPSITGSVQPERRADLRAEVSAVVLEVLKENGDPVRRGDLLVRLDDTAIRDTLTAATASARSASQAHTQAERQFQRLTKLRESGLVSAPDVEDAEIRRNNAQSDLEMARTREVTARQQLQRTQVRAPFDGVVSDRQVSTGDTAQIGKELLKVVDPGSMRFEGRVSVDSAAGIAVGQRVTFRVHGFGEREFGGAVMRVSPSANPTTRQVEVLVGFLDARQLPKLAGLYAEGHIEAASVAALTVPENALTRSGADSFAWRIKNRSVNKVRVELGRRDARTGELLVKSGLLEGDRILRYPASTLRDGQKVSLGEVSSTATAALR